MAAGYGARYRRITDRHGVGVGCSTAPVNSYCLRAVRPSWIFMHPLSGIDRWELSFHFNYCFTDKHRLAHYLHCVFFRASNVLYIFVPWHKYTSIVSDCVCNNTSHSIISLLTIYNHNPRPSQIIKLWFDNRVIPLLFSNCASLLSLFSVLKRFR